MPLSGSQVTRLWPYGGPGHNYGSFAGKSSNPAVFPDPSDVRAGITYGPTGADYTGTMVAGGGSYMRRR